MEKVPIHIHMNWCEETEPCRHSVIVGGDSPHMGTMNGVQIVQLLQKHGRDIPEHFTYCIKLIEDESRASK